jgi:lysophospholipase L1-like esterase
MATAAFFLAMAPWIATSRVDRVSAAPRPGHHHRAPATTAFEAPPPVVAFEFPRAELPEQPETATLAIPGRHGNYLVPYIQTGPDLRFRLRVRDLPEQAVVRVTLDPGTPDSPVVEAVAPAFEGTFTEVPKGEHTLFAEVMARRQLVYPKGTDGGGRRVASSRLTHVARGDIIAALGDSTTEGNGGPSFGFLPNWVAARAQAPEWTSADGRNFPQAGAVARPRAPASFTSALGMILASARGYPVLVLNDGWSGATAEAYSRISSSGDLAAEYGAAKPNGWIINLGVNDPLTRQSPEQFDRSLRSIVNDLASRYGATGPDIHVACPTYAQDSRHDGEAAYLGVINQLRATMGLGTAPDFFGYFKANPAAQADKVHPNAAGYRAMASLWAQALAGQAMAGC